MTSRNNCHIINTILKHNHLLNPPWDFESVIDEIITGEYEIIGCEVVESGIGRLYFEPWAYPYGGTEPLVQLIMPFNIKIIRVEK